MLVSDKRLGAALAASLGTRTTVLMRGHGSTVVGESIEQVVYRAVYAEVNARLQLSATTLGDITFLNEHEATLASARNDGQIGRTWELWRSRVGDVG